MARPRKNQELYHYHFVSVRLSDIELENINAAASRACLSRSEYIRQSLLEKEISVTYEIVTDMPELQRLAGEIGKIGSNLNQIAKRESYMEQPNDHMAGYKHRQTKQFLRFLQRNLMEMCEREGLHQVDLITPAPVKITNEEYCANRRGQKRLDQTNEKILAAGMMPTKTVFQTQKQFLRDASSISSGSVADNGSTSNLHMIFPCVPLWSD